MLVTMLYIPRGGKIIEPGKKVQIFYSEWIVKHIEYRKEKLRNALLVSEN